MKLNRLFIIFWEAQKVVSVDENVYGGYQRVYILMD